jgi:sensor histidine kinase YesM
VFNSLNSVQNFILSNKIPEAANYLSALGKLIRINLEHVSAETITLTDEIVFLEQFINIEKLRFKQALDVTLTCSIANIDQVFLPPMLIQPLVENSIKYGTRSGKQVRSIRIEFGMNNGMLVASVTDNGIGRDRSLEEHDPGHKSVGLNLIKERLDLLNKKNNTTGFQIVITDLFQDEMPTGTKVQVTAPQLDRIV